MRSYRIVQAICFFLGALFFWWWLGSIPERIASLFAEMYAGQIYVISVVLVAILAFSGVVCLALGASPKKADPKWSVSVARSQESPDESKQLSSALSKRLKRSST